MHTCDGERERARTDCMGKGVASVMETATQRLASISQRRDRRCVEELTQRQEGNEKNRELHVERVEIEIEREDVIARACKQKKIKTCGGTYATGWHFIHQTRTKAMARTGESNLPWKTFPDEQIVTINEKTTPRSAKLRYRLLGEEKRSPKRKVERIRVGHQGLWPGPTT